VRFPQINYWKEKIIMSTKEKLSNPGYIGAKKFWGWQARAVSAAWGNMIVMSYLMIYCTSMLGLSPVVIGTLLAVSKVVDAVTDLTAGVLVDRTHTKFGVGRPYEFAVIGLWAGTWAMFSVPGGLGIVGKYVWVMLAYIVENAIFNTLLFANQNAYMVRAFNTNEQRVKVVSLGGIVVMVCTMVVSMIFPTLQKAICVNLSGWSRVIGMFAILGTVLGMLRFLLVKEEYPVEAAGEAPLQMSDVMLVLKNNKYVYMIGIMYLLYNLVNGMGIATYYYTYVYGDISVMGFMSLLSMVYLPLMAFIPALSKRMSIGQITIIGCFMNVAAGLLMFFAQKNMIMLIASTILMGIGSMPMISLTDLMMMDCATYNQQKNGRRMDGVISAIKGFAGKVGGALGSVVIGTLLSLGGFISTVDGAAVTQPDSALFMIRVCAGFVPAALYLLTAFIMKFYKVESEIQK